LFYYNLDEIVKNITSTEIKSLPFKNFDIGSNLTLCYNKSEERIGYFNLLNSITVVPLLHSNRIRFIGMKQPSEIVSYKVDEDEYITLDKKGKVKVWNLLTGKFLR
jgi:hypothetical protein